MKLNRLCALLLLFVTTISGAQIQTTTWQERSNVTRSTLSRMDKLINSDDSRTAYDQYMAMFHPAIKAWGLYENQGADLEHIKQHYLPVFFELEGGVLVSDQVIVAGPMAAQRYHSMMLLNGTFDGVEAKNKPVVIRGQTFFQIDENGLITERWSNHDHAYRMGQLLGEQGRKQGAAMAMALNGPGITEKQGIETMHALVRAFNQAEAPGRRAQETESLLSRAIKLHGIGVGTKDAGQTAAFLEELWTAFPDLILSIGPAISGWSFVAVDWRLTGSQRQSFRGQFKPDSPVCFQGQLIAHLTSAQKFDEVWVDVKEQCQG